MRWSPDSARSRIECSEAGAPDSPRSSRASRRTSIDLARSNRQVALDLDGGNFRKIRCCRLAIRLPFGLQWVNRDRGLLLWRLLRYASISNQSFAAPRLVATGQKLTHASQQNDVLEFLVLHSSNASAPMIIPGGISSPSALAVLRLTTISSLVGCSTGRSAGFTPFRVLST